jgi:hypothetical protein
MTDDARFQAALNRYLIEPEAITDDDISTMADVDDLLATKAAVRRADALRICAETRHRAATGQAPLKIKPVEAVAESMTATVIAHLARPRQRIKALEGRNTELEMRIRSLEGRILELEASQAAAHPTVDRVDR